MIKIYLILKNKLDCRKFFVDSLSRFVVEDESGNNSVILTDVSEEYDGVCDEKGKFHFLIQTTSGGLVYLKYDGEIWKKYNIFQSKDNLQKISRIRLTFSENTLCAFYVMNHNNKNMLVKHSFSSDKLYVTPEIVDVVDSRKCFCICTDFSKNTKVFYRDSAGRNQETVYDRFFVRKEQRRSSVQSEVLNYAVICDEKATLYAYVTVKKSYTTLIFSNSTKNEKEKIITFGISRNSNIGILSSGNTIIIFWTEGNKVMTSKSTDGGENFCAPVNAGKFDEFVRYRLSGRCPGMYVSDCVHISALNMIQNIQGGYDERNDKMNLNKTNFTPQRNFNCDISSAEFVQKLGRIEHTVVQIGDDIKKICGFLNELEDFKRRSEFDVFSQIKKNHNEDKIDQKITDIGEKNEENIKLFESMNIDDVIPNTDNESSGLNSASTAE